MEWIKLYYFSGRDFESRSTIAYSVSQMATAPEQSHQMQTAVNCDTCENIARHLCKSCLDRLCDGCRDIHSKSKGTFDHVVVLLTFDTLDLSPECPSSYVCKWHPKYRASIGCQKCDVPVCDQCRIGEHKGHNVIEIGKFFRFKKEKLEQKLSFVRSELPKYESELENVRRCQMEVSENKEIVKKEIDDYFERVISTLDASRHQLLKHVDEKTSAVHSLLQDKENTLQSYAQNMREYMVNIQNKDLREKIAFIFYTSCELDDFMPQSISLSIPGKIKYSEGRFDETIAKTFSGRLFNCTENIKLLENASLQIVRSLKLDEGEIISLAYCSDPEAFWVYSSSGDFLKYNENGSQLEILKAKLSYIRNKPICVVDSAKLVFFRNNASEIYMFDGSQRKLFIDFTPMGAACLCPTKDDELLIVIVKSQENYIAICRFQLTGECKQYITPMFDKWTPEILFKNKNDNRLYINENLNGDICLSFGKVIVLRANGEFRFAYEGKEASLPQPLLSRGICTDVLGNILVVDEYNRGIHVLNKDGGFLTMLTIPGDPQACPISLCLNRKNNLCIGCKDGKIRILKYLD